MDTVPVDNEQILPRDILVKGSAHFYLRDEEQKSQPEHKDQLLMSDYSGKDEKLNEVIVSGEQPEVDNKSTRVDFILERLVNMLMP